MQQTVYLSGAISNLSMPEVIDKFNLAEHLLINHGFNVVNPVKLDHSANLSKDWAKYMQVDLKALMDCDTIALLPCWKESKGAQLEFQVAKALNYPIIFLEGWN